jgi:hypothetical protein
MKDQIEEASHCNNGRMIPPKSPPVYSPLADDPFTGSMILKDSTSFL